MITWLGVALIGPALLLGPVFPGFGALDDRRPVPAPVERSVDKADLAPDTGGHVAFNDPTGPLREQFALVERLDDTIRSARPGSTVRLAAYSFAMPSTARALLFAHENGVHVQVVVDGHSSRWAAVESLRTGLGTDTTAGSFVRACRLSCRGGRGNQHAKFLTVSSSSRGDDLVMLGSMNLTDYSAQRQWNDLYWVTDPAVHQQFVETFTLMAQDRPQQGLALPETRSGFETEVSPTSDRVGDPLEQRLRQVRCRGAAPGTGADGRTVIRIAMHAWNGSRGIALARQVAELGRAGCDIAILYGKGMGRAVATTLRLAGVPVRDSLHDGRRVHQKVMLLSGRYGGQRDVDLVWTGSHNWSDRSLRNDEVMLRVAGRPVVEAYLANFARMWRLAAP
ncbi:MAG: hypothetical protein H0V42_06320 [Nocardioidaceae bacterium]|nr:hypothetical protein [Nocardioidaceae bacterium]